MTSDEKGINFYLNILEISGKQITNTYVNDLRIYMDKKGLKYKFEIVTDEEFYIADRRLMRGGNTTFPYRHFENTFNTIGNMISFNSSTNISSSASDLNIETKNYGNIEPVNISTDKIDKIDNLDESEESDNTNQGTSLRDTIVDTLLVYNPLELNDNTKTKAHITPPVNLDIPIEYEGVIHILLTIYVDNTKNIIPGGITQLNHFLHSIYTIEDVK
jgi:hypothetical protein